VVPTRDRAELAVAAVRSVAEQNAGVRIVVSDNSSRDAERGHLREACRELSGVHYVRPAESLPMPQHWEWALEQARALDDPTHVAFLTDRMVFRPGSVPRLLGHLGRHPDRVVSYNHDHLDDIRRPVKLFQKRGSDRVFRIPVRVLVERAARAVPLVYLPRMLNCAVPTAVVDRVRGRFGSLFQSLVPDLCFAFRCLAVVDEILYWDWSPLVQYAMDRSRGMTSIRGIANTDSLDYVRDLGDAAINAAAPVPGFRTVNNTVIHEYSLVREQMGAAGWPEVDRGAYLQAIAAEVRDIENPDVRAEMTRLLARQGPIPASPSRLLLLRRLKRITATLSASPLQPLWRSLARRFSISPPGDNALEFASVEEALDHARRFPRRPRGAAHLRFLLGPLQPADP
jgi:glycosyl transferase family 2